MARIRTIKPDFWQHPKVMSVCRDARLLFLGLLNEVDDEGRMRWSAKRVAGVVFPGDEDVSAAEVEIWAKELEAACLIVRYDDDHGPLLAMPGFCEHQRVDRARASILPAPTGRRVLDEASTSPRRSLDEASTTEEEGKGNRKGKGNIAVARARDDVFEAIAEVCGIDWRNLTNASRGPLNKATADLRAVGATPEEIHRRASNWPYDVALTPSGLAKHWPALGTSRTTQRNQALALAAQLEAQGL